MALSALGPQPVPLGCVLVERGEREVAGTAATVLGDDLGTALPAANLVLGLGQDLSGRVWVEGRSEELLEGHRATFLGIGMNWSRAMSWERWWVRSRWQLAQTTSHFSSSAWTFVQEPVLGSREGSQTFSSPGR